MTRQTLLMVLLGCSTAGGEILPETESLSREENQTEDVPLTDDGGYLPDPQPPPAAPPPEPRTVPQMIGDAARTYGLDPNRLTRIAWCESTYRPWATSSGGHKGVFQFSDRTWGWASVGAGYGGRSPYDAEANIYTAAWLMSRDDLGGFRHWTCQ